VAWQLNNSACVSACKLKVKFTIEEAKKTQGGGEYNYTSTVSLTSALDGSGLSMPRRGHITFTKEAVPILKETGRAPRPVWPDAQKLAPTGIRFPDRPCCIESLYGLRYLGTAPLLSLLM